MAHILHILAVFLSICTGFANASKKYKYESSYVFLEGGDGPERRFCANFQQWRSRDMPSSANEAPPKMIDWWIGPNETDICKERRDGPFPENALVPAKYSTRMGDLKECAGRAGFNASDARPVKNQVNVMKEKGARNILFLVDKGKTSGYGSGMHDYLFTHFYNGEIDDTETVNIFYMYEHVFWQSILPLASGNQSSRFRLFQPQSAFPMDPAVGLLWLFAFFSILIGSLWAAAETRTKMAAIRLMNGDGEENGGIGSSRTELTLEEDGEAGMGQGGQSPQSTPDGNHRPTGRTPKSGMKRSESTEIAQMSGWQHCLSVCVALFIVVAVLLLAFFFRDYAVHVFNFFLLILGIFSIHSCLYALLQMAIGSGGAGGGRDFQLGTLRQFGGIFCCKCAKREEGRQNGEQLEEEIHDNSSSAPTQSSSHLDRPILLFSLLLYLLSIVLCLSWFSIRDHHYAFALLDPINIAICIYSIRASRIRSLRLITFLLLAMFVYDLFMVFGTRLLTSDGCSVMLQVVTGMDCRPSSSAKGRGDYQPVAPIDAEIPQKLPLLFYMPMLADPMAQCFDVDVEREFKHVMLGLGDVILPGPPNGMGRPNVCFSGYLVAFCFYMDVVERNRFHTYGLISMIGYSLGMACTFIALLVMETGQPALIYLVPFTLLPTCLWAMFGDKKGTLGRMWRGQV